RARPEQGGWRITKDWLRSVGTACGIFDVLTANELFNLPAALGIPDPLITTHQYTFPSIEALALLCARFQSAAEMYTFVMLYDRSQAFISECFNELVEFLDEHWEHLLGCNEEHLLHLSNLKEYTEAIHRY
ncbi:hypothetical protein K438DRAFT_1541083, partial [Mycena galopus ATCC 62051]